jgi:hypothetical protein
MDNRNKAAKIIMIIIIIIIIIIIEKDFDSKNKIRDTSKIHPKNYFKD